MSRPVSFTRNDREIAHVVMWMQRECCVTSRDRDTYDEGDEDNEQYFAWFATNVRRVADGMSGWLALEERRRLSELKRPEGEDFCEWCNFLEGQLVEYCRVALRVHAVTDDPEDINDHRVMLALLYDDYARSLPILRLAPSNAPSNDNAEAERRGA